MDDTEYYEGARHEMDYFLSNAPKKSIEFGCSNGGFSELLKIK